MNKGELAAYLAKKNRRPAHHYMEAINEILAGIQDQLKANKRVRLLGFGEFYPSITKGKKARNPRTGEEIEYKDVRGARFSAGEILKRAMSGKPKQKNKKKK